MAVKTTLRLPDSLAKRLRERSATERRSFNDTAVRVLQAGLGDAVEDDEWWRALGDLVARAPVAKFDRQAMLRRRDEKGIRFTVDDARSVEQALQEMREDRL